MRLSRTTSTALAAAIASSLVFAATADSASPGDPLQLGVSNSIGAATNLSGNTAGIQFKVSNTSTSASSMGLYGSAAKGTGVFGKHTGTAEAGAGMRGESAANSAGAFGVYGILTAGATNPSSAGVRGEIKSSLGLGYGVWGSHAGFGGGVYGTSSGGVGVYGKSTSGRGVVAESSSGNALEATTSSGLYAGLFNGNLRTTASFSSGSEAFADGESTPSVSGGNVFTTSNSSATTITSLDDGRPGQMVTIVFGDANTMISDAGSFHLAGGFASTPDDTLQLESTDGTNWYEVGRSVN